MRLIDADELKKKFNERSYWTYTHEYGDAIPIGWIMSGIDNAPTVERTQGERTERALSIVDRLTDNKAINIRESGTLRRAILLPERPTGKWIVDYQENEDALFRHGWKCPVCETRNTYGMPPYCMYCGAKLEKAEGKKE